MSLRARRRGGVAAGTALLSVSVLFTSLAQATPMTSAAAAVTVAPEPTPQPYHRTGAASDRPAVQVPTEPVPARESSSPAMPTCPTTGQQLRYLVLHEPGTAQSTARAEIGTACGELTAYYSPIGVSVALSDDPGFADRIGRDRAYSAEGEAATARPDDGAGFDGGNPSRRAVDADQPEPDRSAEQWGMDSIGAAEARDLVGDRSDVLVGVLDSGVDPDHPDLGDSVDADRSAGCTTGAADPRPTSWMPSSSGHGTQVAGTIAAADDGRGVTGVAPGVRIASVKVVDDDGFIYPESAVCGFMWAAQQGMQVANNSYFVDPWLFVCATVPGQAVVYEAIRRAVGYATEQGVLSVAALGNQGLDVAEPTLDVRSPDNVPEPMSRPVDATCDVLPAELPGVLGVAAVGASGEKASYSSYGRDVVDLAAPGGDPAQTTGVSPSGCVLSTVPNGYGYSCGTSMAVPHVVGVAALVAAQQPGIAPDRLAQVLEQTARPTGCPALYDPNADGAPDAVCTGSAGDNDFTGHGLVDAIGAVSTAVP